jgi:hypothetical protein
VPRIATFSLVLIALALSVAGESTYPAGKPVVLAFGGDVHFEGVLESELRATPRLVLSSSSISRRR